MHRLRPDPRPRRAKRVPWQIPRVGKQPSTGWHLSGPIVEIAQHFAHKIDTIITGHTHRVTANNGAPRTGGKVDLDALVDYFMAHPGLIGPATPRSEQIP